MSFEFTAFSSNNKNGARPEKQRELWSFLTWSFFLANFLTATEGVSGSAHAAAMDDSARDATHPDDNGNQGTHSLPGFESVPASQEASAPHQKVAMNVVAPATMPDIGLQPVETSGSHEGMASHSGSLSSAIPFGGEAGSNDTTSAQISQLDQTIADNAVGTVGDLVNGVSQTVEHVVDGVTQTVGTIANTVADIAAELGHTLGDVTSSVTNVVDSTFGAVTPIVQGLANTLDHAATGITDTVGATMQTAGDVLGGVGNVLGGIVPAVMSDIGISSSGSLTFAAETTDPTTDHTTSTTGYSQYNLAVQDAATPDAQAGPTDTGGIGTIITSAFGLGQQTTTNSDTGDHSNNQHPSHILLVDDLTSNLHHGLFG